MIEVNKEISKEDYEKLNNTPKEDRRKVVNNIVGPMVVMGYGIYGYHFYEQDGKYFLRYTQGSSCD